MREAALQQAIQQVTTQRSAGTPSVQAPPPQPSTVQPTPLQQQPESERVVYVRRNLTLAELIIVFALSIGIVSGVQFVWQVATDILPRIEIRER